MRAARAPLTRTSFAFTSELFRRPELSSRDQRFFSAVLEHVPTAIALVQVPTFTYAFVNPAFQRIAPDKHMIGRTIREVWPENADRLQTLFDEVIRTGRPVHDERGSIPLRRADQGPLEEASFSFDFIPLSDRPGMVSEILIIVVEMTEEVRRRHETEALVEGARGQVAELEHVKDRFVRLAAHELRTPVAVLRGCTQALVRTEGDPPGKHRMLEGILRGVERIERVVRSLLSATELELGRLCFMNERVDLRALTAKLTADLAQSASHVIHFHGSEPAFVVGDRERLRQVMVTLIDNAIRYSPLGRDIDVEVKRADASVVVSVRDCGAGIPTAEQARVFQRLHRARVGADSGGMGLGLFVAKAIIDHHGGRISFESKEGEGSTFSFSLPLAPPSPEPYLEP